MRHLRGQMNFIVLELVNLVILLSAQLLKEIDDLANPTRGKIQIALRYMEESRQLNVEILRCAELAPMDHNGFSDPFVKL